MKKGWCRISTAEGDERGLFEVSARHQSRPGRIVKLPLFYQKSPPLSLSLWGEKRERESTRSTGWWAECVWEEGSAEEREGESRATLISLKSRAQLQGGTEWILMVSVPLWVKEKRAAVIYLQSFLHFYSCFSTDAKRDYANEAQSIRIEEVLVVSREKERAREAVFSSLLSARELHYQHDSP